jgi:hypothetical protein
MPSSLGVDALTAQVPIPLLEVPEEAEGSAEHVRAFRDLRMRTYGIDEQSSPPPRWILFRMATTTALIVGVLTLTS